MVVRRKDVAELAGTSPSVVSYVLNGGPRQVAPDTTARVLAAVEQLGYRPNRIARSLRMSRTMTLGLVVPDMSNPFFAELARAVEEASFAQGYTLLVGNSTENEQRQTAYLRTFLDRQVDGVVLVPAHGPAESLPELDQAGTAWVLLDRLVPGWTTVPTVLADNRGGAQAATRHLLEHGRRRVACIAGPEDVVASVDRVTGWREAMAAAGGWPDQLPVRHVPFGRDAGYRAAREMLAGADLDAMFVASDEQALGALRAVTDLGMRCPDDIALVSFDGIAATAYSTPGLTTMEQPFTELGRVCLELLVERIARSDAEPMTSVLPVSLVRRGSCGCPDPTSVPPGE